MQNPGHYLPYDQPFGREARVSDWLHDRDSRREGALRSASGAAGRDRQAIPFIAKP